MKRRQSLHGLVAAMAGKWEYGVSVLKLTVMERVPNQVLLYSIGSCIQQP